MKFYPDYKNIVDAAYNKEAKRIPLYEHGFADHVCEAVLKRPVHRNYAVIVRYSYGNK